MSTNFTSDPNTDHLPTFALKKKHKRNKPPSPPVLSDQNETSNALRPSYGQTSAQSCSPQSSPSNTTSPKRRSKRQSNTHLNTNDIDNVHSKTKRKSSSKESISSPRSARSYQPKMKHTKSKKSASMKSKTPSRRMRHSKSRDSMQLSVSHQQYELDAVSDSEPDLDVNQPNADSIAPISDTQILSLNRTSSICSNGSSVSVRNTPRHSRARSRCSSVGCDADLYDEDIGSSSALLKRLKSENKELRKSRNSLRKNHDILTKIESKLRHKLEIILAKFQHLANDFDDQTTADIDWSQMQRTGDIEGILEAVFNKMGQITDAYVKKEKSWKEEKKRWKALKKKWRQFETQYLNSSANGNESNSAKHSDEDEGFSTDYMFMRLKHKLEGARNENDSKFAEYSMVISKAQSSNKELKAEISTLREENTKLKENSGQFEQYKQEYLSMTKRLKETEQQFQSSNMILRKRLDENEKQVDELEQYKEQCLFTSRSLQQKETEMQALKQRIVEFEADNQEQRTLIEEFKTELQCVRRRNQEMQPMAAQYESVQSKLEDAKHELEALTTENLSLTKRSRALDGLKIEYTALQQRLKDMKAEMEGFQDEYRTVYKAKKKLHAEHEKVKAENTELLSKLEAMQTENVSLNAKANRMCTDTGTQTEFAFNMMEDAHLKALQQDNEYLMKELNFLIAERSRFKACVTSTDFHRGDINSMAVSPINYTIATGGKHDNSVRIWQPQSTGGSEITFVPKQKAFVDGTVLSVNMSEDGVLMAAGCSLKNTPNGYVVVWNLSDNGTVLCNLRSRTLMRFGKVHSVEFMKYDTDSNDAGCSPSKHKHKRGQSYTPSWSKISASARARPRAASKSSKSRASMIVNQNHSKSGSKLLTATNASASFQYLLFGGDTTGCILCWNLASENCQTPVCLINGHSDIIYDLCIVDKKWLFSVSHDQTLMYCDIQGFQSREADVHNTSMMEYVFGTPLFKDDSKYALKSIIYHERSNELIFGARKCNVFQLNEDDEHDEEKSKLSNTDAKYFKARNTLNTRDLDHICNLRMRDEWMVVQRTGINHVKLFNMEHNKVAKTYRVDEADHEAESDDKKYRVYDCGITFDKKYTVLCVAVFNKENANNLKTNRSAIKGFRIPKNAPSKKQQQ